MNFFLRCEKWYSYQLAKILDIGGTKIEYNFFNFLLFLNTWIYKQRLLKFFLVWLVCEFGGGGCIFALRGSCKNVECNLVSYSVKTDTWGCIPAPGPSHLAVWMYIFVKGGISEIYLWGSLKNRGAIFFKKYGKGTLWGKKM